MSDAILDIELSPEMLEVVDFEVKEKAKAELIRAGLFPIAKPVLSGNILSSDNEVKLPIDITMLSDTELGQYLSMFTGLSAYAETIVSMADIDWVTALRVAEFAERIEMLTLPKDKQRNDDFRFGSVHSIKYVRKLRQKELEAQATFKLSASVLRSYEKAVASLSREISRRGNMNMMERYGDNIERRPGKDLMQMEHERRRINGR